MLQEGIKFWNSVLLEIAVFFHIFGLLSCKTGHHYEDTLSLKHKLFGFYICNFGYVWVCNKKSR